MRRRAAGFTLLEIMVAVAILAMTLVVLLEIVTNNIRATNHAKLTTAATFLARTKMSDIEDDILYNGLQQRNRERERNFKDDGYHQFRWETQHRAHRAADRHGAEDAGRGERTPARTAKDPMSMMTGFLGGMMSTFIEPIRIGLQESVRRVTVRVFWDETGARIRSIEVVQYLTDPSQLEKSMGMRGGRDARDGRRAGRADAAGRHAAANPNIPGVR